MQDSIFKDQVIPIWSIIFDGDPSQVYTYSEWDKVKSAVEGSIRSYLIGSDDTAADNIMENMNWLCELENVKLISVNVHNLIINIHRWEIDNSCRLFKLLVKCYDTVPDDLKLQMLSLFSNSSDELCHGE